MALITDFHTHILPGIDDGAKNVEVSLKMLKASGAQGVQCMVATSHFYAMHSRIEVFLEKRRNAWETLKARMTPGLPRVLLGAEVAFFRGISRAEGLEALKIQGTDCMLLEMPFRQWSEEDLDEVAELIEDRGFTIVLAHIERYMMMRENRDYVEQLMDMPLKVQINAEGLLDWRQRGKLVKLVRDRRVHLLGSDCHGARHRPPNLVEGREVLRKKLGQGCLDEIDRFSERLLLG